MGSEFGVQGSEFGVWNSEFGVWGSRLRFSETTSPRAAAMCINIVCRHFSSVCRRIRCRARSEFGAMPTDDLVERSVDKIVCQHISTTHIIGVICEALCVLSGGDQRPSSVLASAALPLSGLRVYGAGCRVQGVGYGSLHPTPHILHRTPCRV